MLLPDEVVVAVESDSSAEVPLDQVGGLGEHLEGVRDDRREKCGAIPSSNADVVRVDGESGQLVAAREDALKECGLLGGDVHLKTG